MTGFVPGLGKSIRTGTLATLLAFSGSGALMAADCSNVPSWYTEFNKNGYHDCDGSGAGTAPCLHLDYVNECCTVGSPTAATQACVEERCSASILVQLGNSNPLPGSLDCNG